MSSSTQAGPKVVLIGAGSAFFGRQTIWSMVSKPSLQGGTLALADLNEEKLGWLRQIAEKAIAATGVSLKLETSTDYRELLPGADFVSLAFAVEGVRARGIDSDISTKHGMIRCSGDTIGPGGTMRTLREVPRQAEILENVRALCPNAWIINWVNPTSAMGIAMMRHFPDLKSLAICDGPHNPRFDENLIVKAGLAPDRESITPELKAQVKIRSAGINHFNWLVEMTHNGKDVTPRIFEALKNASQEEHVASSEDSKKSLANQISWQLANALGYAPMCVWHTQEYLPYFQGHDVNKEDAITIKKWRIDVREKWMDSCWSDMKAIASGEREITDFLEKTTPDHASDIIEALWSGEKREFYINTPNNGSITNMPDDAFVEVLCEVGRDYVKPLPFGEMPRPLLGYCHRVLDEHELAVEAAVTYSRKTLRQAFLASMVAVSIPDVELCMNELLEAERDLLPKQWFKGE
jgi:alpha-galactosidase